METLISVRPSATVPPNRSRLEIAVERIQFRNFLFDEIGEGDCHAKNNTAGLGPGLLGVIGRHAGSTPGFRYSKAMKNSNIVWDEKSLDAFITAPQKALPGTTMPFAGLPDQQERTDLIAYLEALK
jgi:cytochrome c2